MEERLQKVMAHAGVASRRASERLILAGRVIVNGQIVTELGTKVDPTRDVIVVDGELLQVGASRQYLVVNKPVGVISTADDRWGRKTVMDLVQSPGRLYPVGRLDADSEGLLLLTNDGELTDRLTHPRYGAEKTYIVLVRGQPSDAALASLVEGIELTDGMAHVIEVERSRGVPPLAPGMKLEAPTGATWLVMTLAEGHKREIRRMLTQIGHPVLRLIRVRFGTLQLGSLGSGAWRPLTKDELRTLLQATHRSTNPRQPQRSPAHAPRAVNVRAGGSRRPTAPRSPSRSASRPTAQPARRSTGGGAPKAKPESISRPRRTRKTR